MKKLLLIVLLTLLASCSSKLFQETKGESLLKVVRKIDSPNKDYRFLYIFESITIMKDGTERKQYISFYSDKLYHKGSVMKIYEIYKKR